MYAIEFQTRIKKGKIEIPQEYRGKLKENVKVIILIEEKTISSNMIDKLLDSPLKVPNFKPFTREEIHERK
ncbi:MAG: hypothetical protein ACMUJM_17360 [bacterium]